MSQAWKFAVTWGGRLASAPAGLRHALLLLQSGQGISAVLVYGLSLLCCLCLRRRVVLNG